MTLGDRLKALRRELGLSQEAFGAQGFVSAPGWIKIENGQRQASEKLIERVAKWLVEDKYMSVSAAAKVKEELFLLKYLGHRSAYVRSLAAIGAQKIGFDHLLRVDETPRPKPKRGRPPGAIYAKRLAGTGRKAVAAS